MEKREIAIAPINASERHRKLGYKHDCPNCHYSLGFKEKKMGCLPRLLRPTVLYESCQSYCAFCGQKIDWSNVI